MSASHHQPAAALPQRASAAARGRARVAHSNGAPPPTDRRPNDALDVNRRSPMRRAVFIAPFPIQSRGRAPPLRLFAAGRRRKRTDD